MGAVYIAKESEPMKNPDDRSDNVERLQEHIEDTMENTREADDFLRAHGHEMRTADKQDVKAKNERRERAIEGFRKEIQDEARHDARS